MQKRIRVFAGPNGSGKSTIIPKVVEELGHEKRLGVYVNADDIEKEFRNQGFLQLEPFIVTVEALVLENFFKTSSFAPVARKQPEMWSKFYLSENKLYFNGQVDSYLAADVAEFLRICLVKQEVSFTFETVLSHRSKIDFLKNAKSRGYKIYLYYIATENPEINISRVKLRVTQQGHSVSESKIRERYDRSLNNLRPAALCSDRAYLFDNSSDIAHQVAYVTSGENVEIFEPDNTPEWVVKYLLDNAE